MSDDELMQLIRDVSWALGNIPDEPESSQQFFRGIMTGVLVSKGWGKDKPECREIYIAMSAAIDRIRNLRVQREAKR